MTLGENIHNAFLVVFKTLENIEKLINRCQEKCIKEMYHLPADRFLRYSSDTNWTGWIYWSFILLYQRREDGEVMGNDWIDGPVYALEINVDSETCEEPQLNIGKFIFHDIKEWSPGCSPYNHWVFYDPIHKEKYWNRKTINGCQYISAKDVYRDKVERSYWGFKNAIVWSCPLVEINDGNYKEKIFGTIEKLSKM
ncbi:MAG: hypothetical protein PUF29_16590 [Anaerobutyricum hallii]|uniref:hypothetical protein n=1 Tax=Anaerobutyricum hallii TaxID=39488 RepID=UPI0024322335|nr:hypothetical protein [Anaerobutyricum hallii]MDD6590176.1 hypothetical protein [Anaerobutyricum hallii]